MSSQWVESTAASDNAQKAAKKMWDNNLSSFTVIDNLKDDRICIRHTHRV
ncbi:MAG TPA: hypothetical protein VFR94_24435 [Nitrososphaeraceae archaeon]|nr:hypothetical protein [Nitrososphaeraceae archaeon]